MTTAAGSTANPFTALDVSGIAGGGYDSTQIATGGDVIQAVGNTTAGVEGVSNALNGTSASGGNIGTVLAGGTGTSGLAAGITLEIGGDKGSQLFSFGVGTTAAQIATALNQASDSTGVAQRPPAINSTSTRPITAARPSSPSRSSARGLAGRSAAR